MSTETLQSKEALTDKEKIAVNKFIQEVKNFVNENVPDKMNYPGGGFDKKFDIGEKKLYLNYVAGDSGKTWEINLHKGDKVELSIRIDEYSVEENGTFPTTIKINTPDMSFKTEDLNENRLSKINTQFEKIKDEVISYSETTGAISDLYDTIKAA